ncbi:hypothetical protein ACFFK0_04510 [Paenibacillus chartarius]|uniref:Uncharacterized protein n=1 Tax=Paenibacillus chartarius TaxID=747481 RepID=A0ABV6DGF8_9BACL
MRNIAEVKIISRIVTGIAAIIVIGYNAYKVLTGQPLSLSDLITMPVVLIGFFSAMTWGSLEEETDELGRHITYRSSQAGYFVLTALILIVFVAVEFPAAGSQPIRNVPLFIVFCASMVILPVTEFIVSRKYR